MIDTFKKQIIKNEKSSKLIFEPDGRNYYVYRITNTHERMYYYGSRVTKLDPKDDLGIKYFSSASDEYFLFEQKQNPKNFKYKVIKTFDNPADCIIYESYLHQKFNVRKNLRFYNKSNQTPFSWINNHTLDIIEKIKTSNLKIDPETGLTGYQMAGLKTKEKLSRLDPETGLTGYQKIAIKKKDTMNKVDPETGLTGYQKAGLKTKDTMSKVDPETGLTGFQKAGLNSIKTRLEIDPETGLTGHKMAILKAKDTMSKIDPETGLTGYQKIGNKVSDTLRKIDTETGESRITEIIRIRKITMSKVDPETGLTGFQKSTLKSRESNLKIDPETGLTGFQKSGKSRSGNKNPGFKGYYVTPWGKFSTSLEAEKHINMSSACVRNYCTKNILITNMCYNKSKMLKLLGIKDDIVGKTTTQLGFIFDKV